jgi:acetyl-CoA carboxylase carboxyl transferase subunit alpha
MPRFSLDFERPIVEMEEKLEALRKLASAEKPEIAKEIEFLDTQIEKLRRKVYTDLTPWQKVQIARHPERPRALFYIESVFSNFFELHGDRLFKDDPSIVGGPAYLDSLKVMVVGHQKGRNTKENIARNFGMPHPEGYRKALRLMKLAGKFNLPIVCFIDTPGAYPGIGAEERGQAVAIAQNLMEMSLLKTPVVVINIGEGGSGGALALGVGDRLLMLENAYYSVITPEGCASILWREQEKAPEAAKALRITADSLCKLGIVDEVIREPLGGAHRDPDMVAYRIRKILIPLIRELKSIPLDRLLEERRKRLREVGSFEEASERSKPKSQPKRKKQQVSKTK